MGWGGSGGFLASRSARRERGWGVAGGGGGGCAGGEG